MTAFEQGKEARSNGKSEAYNPYRNKGLPSDYMEWVKGWKYLNFVKYTCAKLLKRNSPTIK